MGWFTSKVKVVEKVEEKPFPPSPPDKTPYDKFLEARAHLPNCGTCRWWLPVNDTFGACSHQHMRGALCNATCPHHTHIPPKQQDEVVVEPNECEVLREKIEALQQDYDKLRARNEKVEEERTRYRNHLFRVGELAGFRCSPDDVPKTAQDFFESLKKQNEALDRSLGIMHNECDKYLDLLQKIKRIVGFQGDAVDIPDAVLERIENLKRHAGDDMRELWVNSTGLLNRIGRIIGFKGESTGLPDAVLARIKSLQKANESLLERPNYSKASTAPKAKPATKKKTGR